MLRLGYFSLLLLCQVFRVYVTELIVTWPPFGSVDLRRNLIRAKNNELYVGPSMNPSFYVAHAIAPVERSALSVAAS
jgi:hypothetical protein